MKKILLTGGGTAGHVTPNIALMSLLKERGFTISYVGSYDGIEKKLIEETGTKYFGISSGKLRRYFDLKNLTDPFRVIKGYGEAKKLVKEEKPDVVFSKGGFVTVPVVMAAHKYKIPVVLHESDMTPGLANRICNPYATKVCCNFPETFEHLPKDKGVLTGQPIRSELFEGDKNKCLAFTGLSGSKPILLVTGGSLGSVAVNSAVRSVLNELLKKYDIIHLCGKNNLDSTLNNVPGYVQYEYIKDELKDMFAAADIIISRAGANTICELLALRKPNILIPLPASQSRGDQLLNAASFERQGFSKVLEEETLTNELLLNAVNEVYDKKEEYRKTMSSSTQTNAVASIVSLIEELI